MVTNSEKRQIITASMQYLLWCIKSYKNCFITSLKLHGTNYDHLYKNLHSDTAYIFINIQQQIQLIRC